MLHAEIAHAEEIDARLGIGYVGIELFEERIRVQRGCEACFARARERRVGSVRRGGPEWSKAASFRKWRRVEFVGMVVPVGAWSALLQLRPQVGLDVVVVGGVLHIRSAGINEVAGHLMSVAVLLELHAEVRGVGRSFSS